jgi:hypothetical protein
VSLPQEQAAVIRQKLLEILTSETERGVRNKISDAVAEVARQYTESGSSSRLYRAAHTPPWLICVRCEN